MNKNDQQFVAQKIRTQYMEKEANELDELRVLDAKVKRPANIFAYVFGSISAIVMGGGMSFVMTDIAKAINFSGNAMAVGIIVGIVGLVMAVINYPIYKGILNSRKKKFADQVLKLSEKIINK